MKRFAGVLKAVLFIFISSVKVFANDITWDDIGRGNINLRTLLIEPDNSQVIYAGSDNAVLKSDDGGLNWKNILSVRGQSRVVNFLSFAPEDNSSLYAATGSGLYFSRNRGENWKRIFKGKGCLENECTTITVLPSVIYLGTKEGLFFSSDNGRSWQRQAGELGKAAISAIACNFKEPGCIYVVSAQGLFKSADNGQSWEKIFAVHSIENDVETEGMPEDKDEEGFFNLRYLVVDPDNTDCLYLATSKGVYKSQDKGQTWDLVSGYGLLSRDVRFLLISGKSGLYAATKSAVFEWRNERWQELSLGLMAQDIKSLALDKRGNLYSACDRGLFKTSLGHTQGSRGTDAILSYSKDEPGIDEIQQAAIRYAQVEPEKITRWIKQAAKKAWLPKISVGLDRNTTDLWHWEGGSTTKADDDILRHGRDTIDWDVSLTWDLSELIWNESQTSIDARSRLMVQLRDDVLDEVTKLFFERLRVKMELDSLRIEDRKKRFEKELKLQELTAQLDGLTGGYFSGHTKKKS